MQQLISASAISCYHFDAWEREGGMQPGLVIAIVWLTFSATFSAACPWANGTYLIRDRALTVTLIINSDCSRLIWQIKGFDPVPYALRPVKNDWVTRDSIYDLHLHANGKNVTIIGADGSVVRFRARRLNK
ncbi:hypothetical protein [Pseudodonghicola flavimaris]|uniref:Uncharacterized protein n=1 Tax=Pseudodonghicola flavimaris TaxID=3050036 RepID=A0ABT7EV57_9RHOB|nr:hypothetical protein [Pseudodonghicola flavimaris]MDK3016227.1 hypothetical protein [Pseudodonghicola flavimaris]